MYQLALTLESDKAINQLLSGSEDKNSSLAISMRNLNPNEGNGWSFKLNQITLILRIGEKRVTY